MKLALKEAEKAYLINEVPIGCVIVKNGIVISKAYNKRETTQNVIGHAELLAISKACKKLKSWRLEDCDLYCTLEPCIMCYGAILNARIKNLYIAANNPKYDHKLVYNIKTNHQINIEEGILFDESSALIKKFFKKIRK